MPAFLFTSFWTLEASRSSNLYGGSNGGLVSFSQTLPFFRKVYVAAFKNGAFVAFVAYLDAICKVVVLSVY